jgi:hypothetical protein
MLLLDVWMHRTCLAGLHEQLHERLRLEPCQTVKPTPAPGVKPLLEPLAASTHEAGPQKCGFTRLHLLLDCLALGRMQPVVRRELDCCSSAPPSNRLLLRFGGARAGHCPAGVRHRRWSHPADRWVRCAGTQDTRPTRSAAPTKIPPMS